MPQTSPCKKSILITGCSSGIGFYCAKELHHKGYQVFATARKLSDVETLRKHGLWATQLDLSESESIQRGFSDVLEASGGSLDVLFNNGAYGQPGAVEDLTVSTLREQFEVNLFGWHELTCKVIPIMRKQGGGRIIQNSSLLGFVSMKYRGAYNASKYALEGLTDTLRLELEGSGIKVSLIEPGPINSLFRENAYAAFLRNIDRENSPHKTIYADVEKRLAMSSRGDTQAPFTLGPDAVLKCLIDAIENKKPKIRYRVTLPSHIFAIFKRALPDRWLDLFLIAVSEKENKQ